MLTKLPILILNAINISILKAQLFQLCRLENIDVMTMALVLMVALFTVYQTPSVKLIVK